MSDTDRSFIPERVHRMAAIRPEGIAIRQGARALSYGELWRLSSRLAHDLRARGCAPGSVVAVGLERSPEHIVAMLGILLAGCGFLLLDPSDPPDQIRMLVEDCEAAAVVTDSRNAARLGIGDDLAVLIDAPRGEGEEMPAPVSADSLAYVVYTSGTTGTPNGVRISHNNLRNLVDWHDRAFAVTAEDRASVLAGLSFDASIWEVWPYLAAGATLSLVDDTTRTSPELLFDWLLDEAITIGFVPTALAEPLLDMDWPGETPLRLMLTGGDTLRAYPRRPLPFALINNYGPAECAVVATSGPVPVRSADAADTALPTIGTAIAGVEIHLLDADRAPVAAGEEGDIWIGGESVGLGYCNRPELTARAFAADPFSDRPGARMYRTGDRGRRDAEGAILFCGRTDHQTKIRGVRIELDEVAARLQAHPLVASAVVIVDEGEGADKHLLAYVVPTAGADVTEPDLHAFLSAALPRNLVPARFVTIDAMPLTRNGKLDVAALPKPVTVVVTSDRRAPATPTELRLAAIIEEVLGSNDIAATDNFFLAGGHSLLATQVVIRSRDAFGVDLSLLDLFEAPTIAGFAETIEQRLADKIAAMSEDEVAAMLAMPAL